VTSTPDLRCSPVYRSRWAGVKLVAGAGFPGHQYSWPPRVPQCGLRRNLGGPGRRFRISCVPRRSRRGAL